MKTIIVYTLMFCTLWSVGCKKSYLTEAPTKKDQSKRVKVQELQPDQTPIAIMASGVLASESEMDLSFKVGGIVQAVWVDEGQFVRKGQLLARLDLAEINAQVVQARNNYDKAKRDLLRVKNLYADTVATLEQKQDATTAFEVARASLDIAEFNLKYAQVKAPVQGKVLKRMVEPNELVSAGQPLFVLGSSGNKGAQVINIGLSDEDVVKVMLNDSAMVLFDAFPEVTYAAYITEIAQAANPATGTFQVELTLEGLYHAELKNGFVGKVRLYPSKTTSHYKIPMTALVEGDKKQAKVYLTQNKKTVFSETLKVSSIQSDYFTTYDSLLTTPMWVILEGAAYLSDKDTITIINN